MRFILINTWHIVNSSNVFNLYLSLSLEFVGSFTSLLHKHTHISNEFFWGVFVCNGMWGVNFCIVSLLVAWIVCNTLNQIVFISVVFICFSFDLVAYNFYWVSFSNKCLPTHREKEREKRIENAERALLWCGSMSKRARRMCGIVFKEKLFSCGRVMCGRCHTVFNIYTKQPLLTVKHFNFSHSYSFFMGFSFSDYFRLHYIYTYFFFFLSWLLGI